MRNSLLCGNIWAEIIDFFLVFFFHESSSGSHDFCLAVSLQISHVAFAAFISVFLALISVLLLSPRCLTLCADKHLLCMMHCSISGGEVFLGWSNQNLQWAIPLVLPEDVLFNEYLWVKLQVHQPLIKYCHQISWRNWIDFLLKKTNSK